MTARIDLNADLGEECGDDAAMLALVTSASLAAGGHAGGGEVLERAVAAARAAGVAVGAHPSYPDRAGFGRISQAQNHAPDRIRGLVAAQVATVTRACAEGGVAMTHVKAHGALYADVAGSTVLAVAFVDGVVDAGGSGVAVLGPAGTAVAAVCAERRIAFVAEGFADRAYAPDGSLVPRSDRRAVHDDPAQIAAQAVALATGAPIRAVDGTDLVVPAGSLCIHGDTPGAVAAAVRTRAALMAAGVRIAAPWT